jgi:hypothetical protein
MMSTMKDRRTNLRIRHIGHADEKANLIVQLARLKAMNASQEQKTYILSKAAYAAALAAVNAERDTLGLFAPPPMAVLELEAREIADRRGVPDQWSAIFGDLMFGTPDKQHPYYRALDEIDAKYQVRAAQTNLREAENLLVEWGRENALKGLGAERFAQIEVCFERWPLLNVQLREKFLDILVKMAVA